MFLGGDLGPLIDSVPEMAIKILKDNGKLVVRSTVRSLTTDKIMDLVQANKRQDFDKALKDALGEPLTEEDLAGDPDYETPEMEPYDDADDGKTPLVQDINKVDADTCDQYVEAQVELSDGDKIQTGKVVGRKHGPDEEANFIANTNPILDTRTYDVDFPNGNITEYSTNVIAENMFAQCNMEGNQFVLMAAFVDHKKDSRAVEVAYRFIQKGSNRLRQVITKGWQLCVEWKDVSTTRERLSDLKESYPIEVA